MYITSITLNSYWQRHCSPTAMTQKLNWQSPEHHRHTVRLTESRFTMMYKILHGLSWHPSVHTPSQHARGTEHLAAGRIGHPLQLMVQHSWVQAYDIAWDYEHSFSVAPIEPWNKLTPKTLNTPSQAVPWLEAWQHWNRQCLKYLDADFNPHLHFFYKHFNTIIIYY